MRHERKIKAVSTAKLNLVHLSPVCKKEKPTPEERFANMLKTQQNGCIIFLGAEDFRNGGYGKFRAGKKVWRAHQYAYSLAHGALPDLLRHTCHDPLCCNVDHLISGTIVENHADMDAAGRRRGTLKKEQVQFIVKQYYDSGIGMKRLADQYDVSESAIMALVTGRTWSKVTGLIYRPHKPHQRKLNRKEAA